MSLAKIFDYKLLIYPAKDGSFVVDAGAAGLERRGFTNATDMLSFLQRAAQARQAEGELAEGELLLEVADVVKTVSVKPWPVQGIVGETKRTTAYGSLADRIASTGDNPAA